MSPAEAFVVMAKPAGPLCNLDCSYCYYLPKAQLFPAGERFRMRPEVLEAYIRATIAASTGPVVHFAWHGGEPTLAGLGFFRLVVELQARHLPPGWRCVNNLQTNGTLLDDAWCTFLAEHRFSVGISVDGPARFHDAMRKDRRGRPTHDRVLGGLRRLRAAGIEPDVLCTLNATNTGHPLEVYRFFLAAQVQWLQFLPIVETHVDGRVSERSVDPEGMGAFLSQVFDEWVRYDVGRIAVQNFLEPLLVVSGQPATLCVMAETCGRVPALEHDGSLYACDHFVDPAHRLGDIMTDELGTLLDGPEQAAFGAAKRDGLPQSCHRCPVRFLCHGGCPKDRFVVAPGGEPTLNYLCAGYRRFYDHALPLLIRMAELARTGSSLTAIMGELEVSEHAERRIWQATGRNDSCPCGSGAKYKHCCLPTRR